MTEFWAKVDRTGPCWLWTGTKVQGYGWHQRQYVHRLMWVAAFGAIPAGLFVLHRCDVRACCRPDHLFLGTAADNSADMVRKGRHRALRGEASPSAKLTTMQAQVVRFLRHNTTLSCSHIGRMFGLTTGTVSRIGTGQRWADMPDLEIDLGA